MSPLERLLRALLPPGLTGDSMVGDLREETARYAARGGRLPRVFWCVRALRLAGSYAATEVLAFAGELWRELGRAGRGLRRRPGSSLSAVVVIGLGIGLSATMASVAYGLFVRGLDVPAPEELRVVELQDPLLPDLGAAPPALLRAWRERPQPFRGLAAYRMASVNLAPGQGPAELRSAAWVTPDAFDVLGVQPSRGRGFADADVLERDARVVLLSHELWQDRFAGGDVVGTDVRLDGRPVTVVGIMPPGFAFPINQDLWLPALPEVGPGAAAAAPEMEAAPGAAASGGATDPGDQVMVAFGRIPPGVDEAEAARALEGVIVSVFPDRVGDVGGAVRVNVVRFNEMRGGSILRILLGAMMAAALLVLLVAAANVSGVLLARTASSLGEVGVRAALGGGGLRAAAPFLAQALMLAGAGTLLGLGIAAFGVGLFEEAASAAGKPYWMHVRLDGPILAFAAGTAVMVALTTAVGPVLLALRADPAALLRAGGRGMASASPGRTGRALVVVQIALSCGLLVGSGLVGRSLVELTRMDFPFAREDVLTADVRTPPGTYPDADARAAFHEGLRTRLAEVPGVRRAALTYGLPSLAHGRFAVQVEGADPVEPSRIPRAWRAAGTPGVLDLLGMEPIRGRGFLDTDDADAEPVAVIEQEMAERLFGGADPLGRRFREARESGGGPWRRVVGVTGELRLEGVSDLDSGIGYYVPLAQVDAPAVTLLVEGTVPLERMAADVRGLVAGLDRDVTIDDVKSLREVVGETAFFYEVFGGLFATFGVAGLFMACVGLYGVLSWSVARRVPELGLRMALGASGGSVVGLVLRDAAVQTGIGLALGLGLAFLAGDALSIILFRVDPRDPLVFGAVAVVVAGVALLAAAAPAARALRLDPLAALRRE